MTGYRIIDLITNDQYDVELNTPLRLAFLLPVPYFPQVGVDADEHCNDCGAASGLMVLRAYKGDVQMTVNQFYKEANPLTQNDPLWVYQIRNVLSAHGVPTEYKAPFDDALLFKMVREQKPVIALINYGRLVDGGLTQFTNFKGSHFVVVVGMDAGYIYVHDPYHSDGKGEACAFPIDLFWKAWSDAIKDGNPDRAGFFPSFGIKEAPPIAPMALYKVIITCNAQYIRSGPGENFEPPIDIYPHGKVVTVFEEKNGWGRISDKQWLFLGAPYNQKVN